MRNLFGKPKRVVFALRGSGPRSDHILFLRISVIANNAFSKTNSSIEAGHSLAYLPFVKQVNSVILGGLQFSFWQGELHRTLHGCSQADGGQTEHQLDLLKSFADVPDPSSDILPSLYNVNPLSYKPPKNHFTEVIPN